MQYKPLINTSELGKKKAKSSNFYFYLAWAIVAGVLAYFLLEGLAMRGVL